MSTNAVLEKSSKNGISIIHIEKLRLFHGSSTEGVKVILPAIDNTVGHGAYFTSERQNAEWYALIRSDKSGLTLEYDQNPGEKLRRHIVKVEGKKIPIVYEVEIENMDLVDLRTNENLKKVMIGFQKYLAEKLKRGSENIPKNAWYVQKVIIEAIGTISVLEGTISEYTKSQWKNLKPEDIQPKHILANVGSFFSDYLKELGYDGILAIEGGERDMGNHDSYVIFDSEKIKIIETVKIVKSETHSEVLKP